MLSASNKKKISLSLCLLAAFLSIAAFAYRNHKGFYQTPIDFLIFIRAGQVYQETGQLYQRADNYAEKYHPSAAIFKFPPAFQLMLLPLTKLPATINLYVFTRLLLTGMYILSIFILFLYLKKNIQLTKNESIYFGSLLVVMGCWFMPFFECIRWLLTEIPLLLIFILSFLLITKNKWLSTTAGLLIAYAACAKIYPTFLFGYHLLQKNKASIFGIFIGIFSTLILSLYLYGLSEHQFYVKNILPILLSEQVTDKWINLNIEKFMFIIGVIPEITGKIFQASRALFVGALLSILYFNKKNIYGNEFLIFSLFVTTMFFCFPNYWPQYQIFLIIPIAYLLAFYIKSGNKIATLILLISSSTIFVPDLLWQNILNWDIQRQGLDVDLIRKESYESGTGITLLKYSPATWLTYYMYEYRATTPVIFWLMQVPLLKKPKLTG